MGEIHELFILALSLVCRGDFWMNEFGNDLGDNSNKKDGGYSARFPD